MANPAFGFQVSESGSGYTWSVNSRENKLTPWSNDPVSDTPGEAFYVRDEDSGLIWGPTCLPIREDAWPYVIRHGQGYSRFEHTSHGIALDLAAVRAATRPRQDLAPDLGEPVRPQAAPFGHGLCGVGAGGRRTAPPRPTWSPRSIP